MAEDYDAMVCYLLPKYDDLQNEMIRISGLESAEKPIVVDLGCGSGRFLEKVLSLNPNAMAKRNRLCQCGFVYEVPFMEHDWWAKESLSGKGSPSLTALPHHPA